MYVRRRECKYNLCGSNKIVSFNSSATDPYQPSRRLKKNTALLYAHRSRTFESFFKNKRNIADHPRDDRTKGRKRKEAVAGIHIQTDVKCMCVITFFYYNAGEFEFFL